MRALIAAALVVAACGTRSEGPLWSAAPSPTSTASPFGAIPREACGVVTAWTAPTATSPGGVTIGSRSHSVAAGTRHGATGFTLAIGTRRCLFGGLDNDATLSVGAGPLTDRVCGTLLSFRPASTVADGELWVLEFGALALRIPAATDLGSPLVGAKRCFATDVDAKGDAIATARVSNALFESETLWCGKVTGYAPSTAAGVGTLSVGTRSWLIEPGVEHATDYPKYRGDNTSAGQLACVDGAVNDRGRLVRYLVADMVKAEGGLVTDYLPATGTDDGRVVLSYKYARKVAATTTLAVTVGQQTCFEHGVDPRGDRVITRVIACGGVGV